MLSWANDFPYFPPVSNTTKNKRLKKDKYFEEFKQKALWLFYCLKDSPFDESLYVKKGSKPAQSQNIRNPDKRSGYIGVAKNASKWQTLVCTKTDKIFLGNYETEKEAAKVVDFYSILVKREKAKVNRDYTIREVVTMLLDFIGCGYTFNASNFI